MLLNHGPAKAGHYVLRHVLLASLFAVPAAAADLAPTGTLRAAFLATNPVQGRVDPRTGAITGPVADLMRELARRIGVPFTITPVPDAAAVIDQVKTHKVDIGFLAYEAARAAQVDFSVPYARMASAYAVRADSTLKSSAEVDRAGLKIGAVKGQSQEIYVSANVKNARIAVMPEMPPNDALAAMLANGELDAFAANRQRMDELARMSPKVRVLTDSFMTVGQAIVVERGDSAARIEELNRFLADVLASGFVKASLDRAALAGVEVAPVPKR
jgi:polar amino acid transport system substrate-binding protein